MFVSRPAIKLLSNHAPYYSTIHLMERKKLYVCFKSSASVAYSLNEAVKSLKRHQARRHWRRSNRVHINVQAERAPVSEKRLAYQPRRHLQPARRCAHAHPSPSTSIAA
ncbi:unnamed protein product [Parnassius apollo]|uniref:(apollo) hypothetical protein n=1 Tax=Parnassius apollo TaxID=110799 RepID=A0A8S3XCP2_PARAO|nr:unnamed protein product [Parnassius apollo]